jgi:gas vesicle protein
MRPARSIGSTVLAIAIGILAGAGVALLYAPQSGQDTRQKLLTKGEAIRERVTNDVSTTKDQLQNQISEVNKVARDRAYELGNQLSSTFAAKQKAIKEKVDDLRNTNFNESHL